MSESALPVLKVWLKPFFDSSNNVARVVVSLTKDMPQSAIDDFLLEFSLGERKRDPVRDEEVSTEVVAPPWRLVRHLEQWPTETVANTRSVPVDKLAPHGIRSLAGSSHVMTEDETTPIAWKTFYELTPGPLFDLHSDQGGVLGACLRSLAEVQSNDVYRNIVRCDLTEAPEGTRFVWTFGEGPSPTEKVGPASLLSESVFMIGPIHSNPPTPIPGTLSDYYGYYWFGNVPSNIEVIKDIHHDFFVKVSEFFQDPPSATNPYRSFVLNTYSTPSSTGKNYLRSHIFSYDSQISLVHDYDLVRRMAYEMIHLFLGPSTTDPGIDWLFEGIKNTLSIYLPFRTGFRPPDYFQATMAMNCMKYYTNPLIKLSHEEALALAPSNDYAKELISSRAWAFVILVDFRTRKVAEEKRPDLMPRPLEDMAIKPLALARRKGEPHGIEQFLELLEPLMGKAVRELYEQMKSGSTISLPEKFFGPKTHRMARLHMEKLDFGMDRNSFESGVVKGLKMGSRAEEAGLKEGDKLLRMSPAWKCVDHFEEEMEVVTEREGVETTMKYWPRSFVKVECLKFVKTEE
jgi:hypothetical protein